MKTAKLVIGIISMVLFVLVAFQSCAAGLGYPCPIFDSDRTRKILTEMTNCSLSRN